jgi:hypothetical protein
VADRLGDAKMVEVVRRTLADMSPAGRSTALGLELSEHGRALVEAALVDH